MIRALGTAAAVAAFVLLAVTVTGCGDSPGTDASPSAAPDPVVARVDGREVRQSDVDLARAEARLAGSDASADAALDAAIDGALVEAEAERLGVSPDEAEVDRRLAAVREQMGGEEAFDAALEQTDITLEQFRLSLARGLVREGVQDARFPALVAGAGAVRSFYEENRAELFTTPEAWELGALVVRNEGIAGNAIERLEQGRPFAEVARQFSIDPELKASGGTMGWVDPSSLPSPLRKAVARLDAGEVTPPTEGPGGVWVVKLLGRRPAEVVPLADVREQIQTGLDGKKRAAALVRWLEQAREQAEIERL
jgi:parvulin-like peptidyl-prolyl isomerase